MVRDDGRTGERMAIFAVLADKANEALKAKIAQLYPADHYILAENEWLVSADMIAQTLAEQLDVRTGQFGRVLVVAVTGKAAGWHSQTVWDWITQKGSGA